MSNRTSQESKRFKIQQIPEHNETLKRRLVARTPVNSSFERDDSFKFKRSKVHQVPNGNVVQDLSKARKIFSFDTPRQKSQPVSQESPVVRSQPVRSQPQGRQPLGRQSAGSQMQKLRRESIALRGTRMSNVNTQYSDGSFITPHEDVAKNDLYKILPYNLPDPQRMKQLLGWCAQRVMDKEAIGMSNENNVGKRIARVIKMEVLKDLADGRIDTSWWRRHDITETPQDELDEYFHDDSTIIHKQKRIVVPNEQNIHNQTIVDKLQERLAYLKDEITQWEEIGAPQLKANFATGDKQVCQETEHVVSERRDATLNVSNMLTNLELHTDTLGEVAHVMDSANTVLEELAQDKVSEVGAALQQYQDAQAVSQQQLLRGISKRL